MPTRPVFGFNDPGVRIEPDFLGETLFYRGFRHRLRRCGHEEALDRPTVVIDGLRRRDVEHGLSVEQRHLYKHCSSFFSATPAHGPEYAFGLAAAQVSRYPDARFQSHGIDDRPAANSKLVNRVTDHGGQFADKTIGDLPGHRQLAVALEFLNGGLGIGADGASRL
jgi:hypothetical protein